MTAREMQALSAAKRWGGMSAEERSATMKTVRKGKGKGIKKPSTHLKTNAKKRP